MTYRVSLQSLKGARVTRIQLSEDECYVEIYGVRRTGKHEKLLATCFAQSIFDGHWHNYFRECA